LQMRKMFKTIMPLHIATASGGQAGDMQC